MNTQLPLDLNNNPVPALRLKSGGAHKITVSATSARNTTALGAATQVVSLYATVPVYIKVGGPTVTATTLDHYFPAGIYYDFAIGDDASGHATHIAVLRVETDGSLYISEKF